jgi:hypothetical protein
MLTMTWKLVPSAIVITTVTSVTLAMARSAPHADAQLPACAQVLSTVMDDLAATAVFQKRVNDYVTMHRILEGPLPTLEVSTDMRKVQAAMDALAVRIQAARKDVRQGDIFTEAVAPMFHRRIASCLVRADLEAILADQRYGEQGQPVPRVNAVWPVRVPFDIVPPQLLAALPRLPPELQYRIIGSSLVLWDHHANLIVDILPGALAPGTQVEGI